MPMTLDFTAALWESRSEAAWVFVSLPGEDAEEIRERIPRRAGFGSVRVEATIGATIWTTSLFPDKASGTFLLPVKKRVREAEGVIVGDQVAVSLQIDAE